MTEDNRLKMHRIKKDPQELDPRESSNPQRDNPTRWERFKQEAAYAGRAAGTFVKDNWTLIAAFAGGMIVKTLLEDSGTHIHTKTGDHSPVFHERVTINQTNGHPGYLIEDPESGEVYGSKGEAARELNVSRGLLEQMIEDGTLKNRGINTGIDFL